MKDREQRRAFGAKMGGAFKRWKNKGGRWHLRGFAFLKQRNGPPLFMICSNSAGRLPLIQIREQRRAFGAHAASGFQQDGRTKEAGDTGKVFAAFKRRHSQD